MTLGDLIEILNERGIEDGDEFRMFIAVKGTHNKTEIDLRHVNHDLQGDIQVIFGEVDDE